MWFLLDFCCCCWYLLKSSRTKHTIGWPNKIQIPTNFPKYENGLSRKKKLCPKTNLAQDVFDKILCGGESYKKLVLQRREREFSSKIRQISQLPG